jgi:hypothetical protein
MSTTWEEGGRQGGIESAREVVEGSRIYTTLKHALYLYFKLSFTSLIVVCAGNRNMIRIGVRLIVVRAAIC